MSYSPQNPYSDFGRAAASEILHEARRLPPDARTQFLQKALNEIDSGMYMRVELAAKTAIAGGAAPGAALRTAMEEALSKSLFDTVMNRGLIASAYQDLGGFGWLKKVGQVAGAVAFPPSLLITTESGRKFSSKVLDKVQSLACKATSSGVGQLAAAGGAAYAGAPPQAGAQGAQTVASLTCPAPTIPILDVPASSLLVPGLIAGGVILVALVATR